MAALSWEKTSRHFAGNLHCWPGPSIIILATLATGFLLAFLPLTWAVSIVGITAVLVLAVIQPLFALGLALITGPFGALESFWLGGASFDSGQLLLLLALAAWIGRRLIDRQFKHPRILLLVPLLLFISIGLLSLFSAPDKILGLTEVIKWIEITTVMLMVADLGSELGYKQLKNRRLSLAYGISWIVIMVMAAAVVQALIGIWQFMFRGEGPEHFVVLGRFYRAFGTFEQPNPFGGYMNLTALLAIGILIGLLMALIHRIKNSASRNASPENSSYLCVIIAVLAVFFVATMTTIALVFSWSRGAWMGFMAGLTIMAVFWPKRLRYGLLLFFIAIIGLVLLHQSNLLPPTIIDRVSGFTDDLTFDDVRGVDINDDNYSVLERLAHWQAALDMAGDRPWFGIGIGNYGPAYTEYALLNWPDALGHAHNYYLNALAEVGVIGLMAYMLLWGMVFWQTLRILGRESWPVRGVALGLMGVWTALTFHHMVDKLYVNNIYIHLGVLMGLLQLVDFHTRQGMKNSGWTEINS
jgi:putative inorganic carbon (HCO3(-)) transporter